MSLDQTTLFSATREEPLAQKMRPKKLDEFVGQRHFLNDTFRRMLESDRWTSLLFWGPPGTGKTTLAGVIAKTTGRPFVALSAVTSGVKEIREVLERSKRAIEGGYRASILFIDEVHRLNKAQQDVLLPYLEDGSVRFIGATTENPSFEINNAVCSRSLIFAFKTLSPEDIEALLSRAVPPGLALGKDVLDRIADVAHGDARRALTLLEHLVLAHPEKRELSLNDLEELAHAQSLYYDKKSESHYDTISAFIKSVRGSDPDAALYYLARMIEGGEDPRFIARRLIILASEDIGNANPMGLVVATSAFQAVDAIGMPEGRIVLAQATTYLACSEKSNRSYQGINDAMDEVKRSGPLEIPFAIRNAPTTAMKEWGYGKGYQYPHNASTGWIEQQYLPDALKGRRFYQPTGRGAEQRFQEFLRTKKKDSKSE